jgi:GNAT superfamily N-acetyltransferase
MLDVPSVEIRKKSRLEPEGLELRMATVADVPALVKLGKEQFETSKYAHFGVEYSEVASEKYLTMVLENMYLPHIVACIGDEVVGGISYSYDNSFSKKPIAILQNIFVTKKYRRTLIGRMLISTALHIAQDEQACAFFAPVNNGGDHVHSLGNSLGKAGFKLTGYIMSKEL